MADDGAAIDFWELKHVIGIAERRAARVIPEIAPEVAEALVTEVLEVFETEGYGEWPRFWWEREGLPQPNTRRFKGGGAKLLQDTGNLVGSITPAHEDDEAIAYTNVPYAKYHASHEPREVIPLRDFFAIDQQRFSEDVADMILLRLDRPMAAE